MFIFVLKIVFIYCRVLHSFISLHFSWSFIFPCFYYLPSNNLSRVSVSCMPVGPVFETFVRKGGKPMTYAFLLIGVLCTNFKILLIRKESLKIHI